MGNPHSPDVCWEQAAKPSLVAGLAQAFTMSVVFGVAAPSQDFPAAWVPSAPPALCCQTLSESHHSHGVTGTGNKTAATSESLLHWYLWVLWPMSPRSSLSSAQPYQGLGTIPVSQFLLSAAPGHILLPHTKDNSLKRLGERLFSQKMLVQSNLNIPWDHFHLAKKPDILLLTHFVSDS